MTRSKTSKDNSVPTWRQGVSFPTFPKLTESVETDVVIIGGGLTGLLCAYLVAQKGKRAVVLEKDTIGSGATSYTTGFLTQSIDTSFTDLIWMLGKKDAKHVIESHGEAIDLIEKIVREHGIECEFIRCDNVVFAGEGKESDAKTLKNELEAARTLGLDAVLESASVLPFPNAGSLRIKQQAKFHPLKFLAGLAIVAQKAGVTICEHTEVSSLEPNENGVTVCVGNLRIKAAWSLSAAYEPFAEPLGLYLKKAMYASYVMELAAPKGTFPEGTYEDTENPYHYFRVDSRDAEDRILIGGEDHRLDVPVSQDKNFSALEEYVRKICPLLSYDIVTRWQGHVLEPIDGLAFIGCYKENQTWYAFGFSGNGMTYAAIAAIKFCDAVVGYENSWGTVYDVGRIPGARSLLVKGRDFAGEFIHGALENTLTQSAEPKLEQK